MTKDDAWFKGRGALLRGQQVNIDPAEMPNVAAVAGVYDGGNGGSPEIKVLAKQLGQQEVDYQAYLHAFKLQPKPLGSPDYPGAKPNGFEADIVIPLSCISGIFETDALLPSFLMAGARIELQLKTLQQAMVALSGSAPANAVSALFEITQPKLVLETVTLTDATLRAISMTSASSGLEMPFVQVHQTQTQMTAESTSIQINRGLSRANMVVSRVFDRWKAAAEPYRDSVCARQNFPAIVTGFQVKLGAEFMPSRRLEGALRLWQQAQVAFGSFKADYCHSVDFVSYLQRLGYLAQTLEKSSTLAQSGSPISASRDLNIVIENSDVTPAGGDPNSEVRVDVWVPHVALATVFLDSVLIRN
jgi:hypothetical protein